MYSNLQRKFPKDKIPHITAVADSTAPTNSPEFAQFQLHWGDEALKLY